VEPVRGAGVGEAVARREAVALAHGARTGWRRSAKLSL
jgi:hypothetical protein